jgi:imidazolonepropionase-like amidohydrolase
MKKVIFVSLGAVLLASTPLAAQSTDRVTVIHAGKLLDMPGNPPRGPSTVIIRNGKIAEVLAGHQQGPAGATLIRG